MKKVLIFVILAILTAILVVFYFGKERINLSQSSDDGAIAKEEKSNLKENLQILGNKIKKEAKSRLNEAEQSLKDEQKYHEQLKNEANRDIKIFEPIYKSDKDEKMEKKEQGNPQNRENESKKQPSKKDKKIEIDIN